VNNFIILSFIIFFKRIQSLICQTNQNIKKNDLKGNFQMPSEDIIKFEFESLENLIDNDDNHKKELYILDKNLVRYKEIFPYKHNIITISNEHKVINASWVNTPNEHCYIAAQGPLDNTKEDFWQMCFEYNVKVIVMLCQEEEDKRVKCATYWKLENSPNFEITSKEVEKNDAFIIRKIEVTMKKNSERKTFEHIQYLCWPDYNIPNLNAIYEQFAILLKFVDDKRGTGPIVVHCSAGIGRTGTFISFHILYHEIMNQLSNGNDHIKFNVFNTVRKMKEYRMYSVQTLNQYQLIYYLISSLLN
jgi:protein tyrosine phosphatase